jgi:hypothetical protein
MGKTNSASNAKLQYEAGQEYNAMTAMTDSGDHKMFSLSGINLWSPRSGYEPVIRPDGLATGGEVTPGSANNNVSVAALTCFLAGVLTTVSADSDVAITSPTSTHNISSVTINSSGVIAVVAGTDGTAFSATRGAAGGPPLIPVGSIEIAQVKLSSATSALITARGDLPDYWHDLRTVGLPRLERGSLRRRDHLRLGASGEPYGKYH